MKITILDQIEITSEGHLNIRMRKQIVDGGETFDLGYHRTSIECGGNCASQLQAVNEHLDKLGFGPISDDEIAQIKLHASIAFTPEKIAKYQNRVQHV